MEILRAHAKLLLSLLGSAILALIVALVLAAISVSGVTSMTAADVFLWIALVIFACAVGATAIITCPSLTGGKSALLVLLLVLLFGAGLVGRNGIALWLNKRKAEQIALETPARPIVAATSTSAPLPTNVSKPVPEKTQAEPAPKVAIRPKPTPKEVAPLANPPAEQTPSRATPSTVNIAPGGFATSGGYLDHPTIINPKPPPPEVIGQTQKYLPPIPRFVAPPTEGERMQKAIQYNDSLGMEKGAKEYTSAPGLELTFHVSSMFVDPNLAVSCDPQCEVTSISTAGMDRSGTSFWRKSGIPSPLTPGTTVIITVRSGSDEPIRTATIVPVLPSTPQ